MPRKETTTLFPGHPWDLMKPPATMLHPQKGGDNNE